MSLPRLTLVVFVCGAVAAGCAKRNDISPPPMSTPEVPATPPVAAPGSPPPDSPAQPSPNSTPQPPPSQ